MFLELQKSILVTKSTETDVEDWEINFTDTLYMMLQDSRSMIELQLNIPDEGKFLLANYDKLLRSKVKMQATDTNSTRLNSLLDDIQNISLFKLPSQPCDPEEFVSYVEDLVIEYILRKKKERLLEHFEILLAKALGKSANKSLDTLSSVFDIQVKRPQKPLQPGEIRLTFHRRVLDLSDLQRHLAFLDSAGKSIQPEISKVYKIFLQFEHVWAQDREKQIQPNISMNHADTKALMKYGGNCCLISLTILTHEEHRITERLLTEVRRWFTLYGNSINRKYLNRANEISDFMHDKDRIINLPVKELSDVQRAMNCFETVQENFIDIDMDLEPIQDAYALLIKFKFPVDPDEHEKAKSLPETLDVLVRKTRAVANELAEKQYDYLETLKTFVETFKVDVAKFDEDYQKRGPMVEGITPEEASQRVDMFSDQLNQLYGRYESYKDGEELFALPVSEYPSLVQSKKDMVLLQKLFTLFNQVMKKITGYFQYTWENVDVQVMTEELTDFQNKCLRLPKGCKDWSYFSILKQRIEDFKETCPLLTRLRNEAMTMNHWKRIEKVCNHKFDDDQSKWTLGTVMEAPLLVFKDDVEDICIAAEKEREIEAKLNQIFAEWAVENLFFSNFKNRGELLLKGTEAGETVVKLEDGLMTLDLF
ncbi:dynein heavy chain 8, axonemal [Caerostris extrusa]|uniref:Dynein heavy chain 8, axonemal n=1 Tax=Caerostris extrusa TaxID=172846 RepID=A0AAV4VRL3_CAEEX|nr:dynein heavy chain 8, axonemal [Caerostris extrusa]